MSNILQLLTLLAYAEAARLHASIQATDKIPDGAKAVLLPLEDYLVSALTNRLTSTIAAPPAPIPAPEG